MTITGAGTYPGRCRLTNPTMFEVVEGVHGVPGVAPPSVVLVDDSREVRGLVRRLLESTGFDVVGEGGDGDEAILLAHRHQPDLLLLDTSMPTVDGIEALPAILALSPTTKVVIFTGFEEPRLAIRARGLGAADVVEKSAPFGELPGRLMRVVNGPAMPPDLAVPAEIQDGGDTAVLSQHAQQFRELFDRAQLGMATLTSSGTVVRANRALAGLMSCTPDDLVGVDYGRLTVGKGVELDRCLDDISSLGADLTWFEHPLPATTGEESFRTVSVTLAPIRDSDRQVLYVFAQVQDVTSQHEIESDLKRSEESLRRLVGAVSESAIFMLDVEGTVVSWNPGAQRIKGYLAHEILGHHFRVFYPAEDQATGHPEDNLRIALRDGSLVEEGWRIRKDGSRFWAGVVITPVCDDTGQHMGFAKVTRDQSQQRQHEQAQQRFIDDRVRLLAVTAHELRTPTAVIDGSAVALGAARGQVSDSERAELLKGIRTSADRLRLLAADLTDASRPDGATLPLRLRDLSLAETLHSAVSRRRAAGTSSRFEVSAPEQAVFQADADRLAQALDNLLDNAVRHGAPPICLIGTLEDRVIIRVTDGGAGIPEDLVPHLFDRFAIAGPSGGTGLGLYLVRQIARRHGGEATYHRPHHPHHRDPTTFEISLPRVPVQRERGGPT